MGKTTYSIRKGFEYQDLYCALALLDVIEQGNLDAKFQIESEEVDHIDDLVIRIPGQIPSGNQVKFHTTQDHVETFDTLMKRKTPQSSSLIEKLYRGWRQLSGDGGRQCRIAFISSNGVARGRYSLGASIETASGKIGAKFFTSADYKKIRETLGAHLGVTTSQMTAFLESVVWRFSYESIDGLRRLVSNVLTRLNLPVDDAAVSQLMQTVAFCATEQKGELTLTGFIQLLWKSSRFREACEQRFSGVDWLERDKRRANRVVVAVVKLDCLPAYSGSEFDCCEEPLPLEDYRHGITIPAFGSAFTNLRTAWRGEYTAWNLNRIRLLLSHLERFSIDILLFPRFSLGLDCATTVAAWCEAHECNVSLGGHSIPLTAPGLSRYEADFGVHIDWQKRKAEDLENRVADVVVRRGRAGRMTISELDSPYKTSEVVEGLVEPFDVQCRDGWMTVVSLPSAAAAAKYLSGGTHGPELILSSCGVHADPIIHRVHGDSRCQGVPVAMSSSSPHVPPTVKLLSGEEAAHSADEWEGVTVYQVNYERTIGAGWQVRIDTAARLPIVYHTNKPPTDGSQLGVWLESLEGAVGSKSEAASRVRTDGNRTSEGKLLLFETESPASLFVRRAKQAEEAIRGRLATAPPAEMRKLIVPLEDLARIREKRELTLANEPRFAPAPPPVPPLRSLSFIDRTDQRRDVARFVEGSSGKRILHLHGPPGIGKSALLADVQRVDKFATDWVRFRCVADTSLAETLAQIMIRLGDNRKEPIQPDLSSYETVCRQLGKANVRVLIFEDAHNLPIDADRIEHSQLLEFFAFICRTSLTPAPKLLLVSDWRGHLNFSGNHLLESLRLEGLDGPDMLKLLQELAAVGVSKYPPPSIDELELIANKTHGHPYIGQLAIAALENTPAAEVIQKLHQREEIRKFVINKLLGRTSLSPVETKFLQLASVFRIPVSGSAFSGVAAAQTNNIIAELVNRFLLMAEGDAYKLHPLISDYFRSQIASSDESRELQQQAHTYFQNLQRTRKLTLDEKVESIFHAFSSDNHVHFEDLRLFTGPIRTAMFEALHERDWPKVQAAAEKILQMFPEEAVAKVANAVSLDATGRSAEAEQFFDSVRMLEKEHIWVAIEFAKSRVRRRDFPGAERLLEELEQRFGSNRTIQLTWAQLKDKEGQADEAISRCQIVLDDPGCTERDAFRAGLILRDANNLQPLIEHVQARYDGRPTNFGLQRLYGYACVITYYAPDDGLSLLSQLWTAAQTDGYVIADYASALSLTGRTADANQLFEYGLQECKGSKNDRRTLLEEYTLFLGRADQTLRCHELYRELLRIWPYALHNHRRFAQALLNAASAARSNGRQGIEDSCLIEAEQVIRKLLEIAPADQWAVDFLHRVEHRLYD